jgi:hypothetical protein
MSCIEWVTKFNKRLRTKHLTARKACIREAIDEGRIDISYCSTKRMIADMFTKSLPGYILTTFIFIVMGMMKPLHDIASRGAKENTNARFGYYHDVNGSESEGSWRDSSGDSVEDSTPVRRLRKADVSH